MSQLSGNSCSIITLLPLGVECESINASTPISANGLISIFITGGTPPYTTTWSNGSQGSYIFNLLPGSYTATTTDYWIGLTNKSLTVTLPNAANGAVQGRQYLIVDCVQSGNPSDTIVTQAGATVVGGSLSQQGQSKTCVFIAATNTWYCN